MDAFVKLIYDHVGLDRRAARRSACSPSSPRCSCALALRAYAADGVLAGVKAPGQPAELPGVLGPQRGVAAPVVEVPAAAAALDPDRVLQSGLQALVVAPLHRRLDLDRAHAGPAQEGQRAGDVVDVRLDHVDHGVVGQRRVGPDHEEQVGEAGHRGARRRPRRRSPSRPRTAGRRPVPTMCSA